MKSVLIILALYLTVTLAQRIVYVDQQTTSTTQDGTSTYPYKDLTQAFTNLTTIGGTINFVRDSYNISSMSNIQSTTSSTINILLQGPAGFNLIFNQSGYIYCQRYNSVLTAANLKNVKLTFNGMNIDATTSNALFNGSCNFTIQNSHVRQINSSLFLVGYMGNVYLKNLVIDNMSLNEDTYLIDHDSIENLQADYLTLDNVDFRNTYLNSDDSAYTMIKSFIQYAAITVTNSYFEGVGFNIKGEQIGGNKKSDITVKNVTMRNSSTFFFIESFGNVVMQDSVFENAKERAILYFLTDENLSPNQTITSNCTFRNNKAPLEGAAIAFQGSKETSYQFTLNVQIESSSFYDNNASLSGGALAFLLLRNGNFVISDSEFISNIASEGGGAIHVDQGDSTMTMLIYNNLFESNTAFTGGVFDFEFMNEVQVTLHNNNYTNNAASFEGGLGFVSESTITLQDTDSIGTGNSASFEGGAWSLKGQAYITFTNIKFINTNAFLKGGCIFNSAAFLTLKDTTFQNCSLSAIGSLGGAVFISEDATIGVSNSEFINNQAEYGASIIYQSAQSGTQEISDVTITFDLTKTDIPTTIQSQIRSDSDGLVLKDITIPTLKTPFLSHSAGTIQIDGLDMTDVDCRDSDNSLTFCIFDFEVKEGQVLIAQVKNVEIQNVYSTTPLILAVGSNLTFSSVTINDVDSTASVSVASIGTSIVSFDQLTFTAIDSVWITSEDGYLTISNSNFDNKDKVDAGSQTLTQFIVSSNDQIEITSSTFNYNSAVYPIEGGALSLVIPTSFTLKDLHFTGNKAIYGGAIYIESSTVNGLVSGCTFKQNSVLANTTIQNTPGFGGALYFTNSSSSSSSSRILADATPTIILIEDATFEQNSGYTGGAIYTRGLNFTLNDVSFTKNSAVSGGALALEIDDKNLIIVIKDSEFLDNNADLYGASYINLRENVTTFDSTVIKDGTQKYTTGAPALLRIRTFNYSSQVLLDSSRNVDDLLAKKLISLTYDSFDSSTTMLTLKNVSSGGYLSQLLQITVCDASKQPLTELTSDEGNVSISVANATYPPEAKKEEYSLAGITLKTLTNGSAVFLDEMNIFAYPETLLQMQVTVLITQKMLGNLNYNLDEQFKIQLNNCSIGEIFHQETLICDPCKADYFSLTDPFSTSLCQKCDDDKAVCPGGSIVYPKKGYWRLDALSDNVVTCPNEEACLGGQLDNGQTNLTGFCAEGYTGNACATCEEHWGKFGSSEQCTNCDSNAGYYVKLFALLAIQVTIIIFNIYSNLGLVVKRTFEDFEKEKVTIYQSTVIKVLVDYAQVLGIVAAINIEWPVGLGNFGNVVSNSVPSSKDSFSLDCFIALGTGTNDHIFFYKILALNIQPFVYIFMGTMFWVILTKIRKQNLRGNQQFKDNVLVTNTIIAYILQPEIVKSTLQLFKCVNLGPLDDPQDFLQKDMEIVCGSSTHLRWAIGLGVPSLIIWLGMPIAFGLSIFFRINHFNNEETLNKYHFLFKRYKKDKIYWDLTIIVRKAALIFFLVFLTDLYSQIFFSFAVFIFCLHLHYKNEPYSVDSLNHLETLGLISNCSLLFGGLFFIEDDDFGVVHGFLMAVAFLINLLFLYRVAKALWLVFSKKVKAAIKMLKDKKFFGKKVPQESAPSKGPEKHQKYLLNDDPKDKMNTPSSAGAGKGDNQSDAPSGKGSNDSANPPKEDSIMFSDLNKELEIDNDNDIEIDVQTKHAKKA